MRRRVSWISVAILALVPFCAAAQENVTTDTGLTLKATSSVVNVYAIVEDKPGHPISSLGREDFRISQNGDTETIRYFSREAETPLSLAVAVDVSPSQARLLPEELTQSTAFLRSVVHPDDNACVLRFGDQVELLQDFTSDLTRLSASLEQAALSNVPALRLTNTPTSGGTRLYDAITAAAARLSTSHNPRKVLVIITDGEDQGSTADLRQALTAAQAADTIVYSVLIHDPAYYLAVGLKFRGDRALDRLASETGGRVLQPISPKGTASALAAIAAELHSQYFLGFAPPAAQLAGCHALHVAVRPAGLRVRARAGYCTSAQ